MKHNPSLSLSIDLMASESNCYGCIAYSIIKLKNLRSILMDCWHISVIFVNLHLNNCFDCSVCFVLVQLELRVGFCWPCWWHCRFWFSFCFGGLWYIVMRYSWCCWNSADWLRKNGFIGAIVFRRCWIYYCCSASYLMRLRCCCSGASVTANQSMCYCSCLAGRSRFLLNPGYFSCLVGSAALLATDCPRLKAPSSRSLWRPWQTAELFSRQKSSQVGSSIPDHSHLHQFTLCILFNWITN